MTLGQLLAFSLESFLLGAHTSRGAGVLWVADLLEDLVLLFGGKLQR
jgi:hypothetical protein